MSLPTQVSTDDVITSFNWNKATVDDISSYSRTADIELRSINVPGGLMCRDMHCHDVHHLESIDVFYSDICNALAHSSAQCIDVCRTGSAKDFIVPCFNEMSKLCTLKLAMHISFGEILGDLELGRLASECARHALPLSMRYVNVSALKILCVPMH